MQSVTHLLIWMEGWKHTTEGAQPVGLHLVVSVDGGLSMSQQVIIVYFFYFVHRE